MEKFGMSHEMEFREHGEEPRTSKISLHFMRHGKPESMAEGGTDKERHLGTTGIAQALHKSKSIDSNLEQSLAYGSPRIRSQETAGIVMAGDRIPEDVLPGGVKEFLNQDLKVGSKIGELEKLNFNEGSAEYSQKMNEAYGQGNYFDFIAQESDTLAEKLGDLEASSLSMQAGNIAEVIKKYIKASPRWNELVNDSDKNYTEDLERYLGSHQGVVESFLYKAVKDNDFKEKLILNAMKPNGGFDFTEGLTIEIVQDDVDKEPQVMLKFSDNVEGVDFTLSETLSLVELDKMILEKELHLKKAEFYQEENKAKALVVLFGDYLRHIVEHNKKIEDALRDTSTTFRDKLLSKGKQEQKIQSKLKESPDYLEMKIDATNYVLMEDRVSDHAIHIEGGPFQANGKYLFPDAPGSDFNNDYEYYYKALWDHDKSIPLFKDVMTPGVLDEFRERHIKKLKEILKEGNEIKSKLEIYEKKK